jgi:hypothetical protein
VTRQTNAHAQEGKDGFHMLRPSLFVIVIATAVTARAGESAKSSSETP